MGREELLQTSPCWLKADCKCGLNISAEMIQNNTSHGDGGFTQVGGGPPNSHPTLHSTSTSCFAEPPPVEVTFCWHVLIFFTSFLFLFFCFLVLFRRFPFLTVAREWKAKSKNLFFLAFYLKFLCIVSYRRSHGGVASWWYYIIIILHIDIDWLYSCSILISFKFSVASFVHLSFWFVAHSQT